MRVILDANIWISYLLAPNKARTTVYVVVACFGPSVTLLFPSELQAEIQNSVRMSSYLSRRIPAAVIHDLLPAIHPAGEVPPLLSNSPNTMSRDPEDDFLLAYGLLHAVDYLVTGDHDLLVLDKIDSLAIVTPSHFLRMIGA